MTEYQENKELVRAFRDWVLTHKGDDYKTYALDNAEQAIVFETDYCRGEVAFYPYDIIQLSVVNKKSQENVFYLHFQMHTQEHARDLFSQMLEVVQSMTAKPRVRVLLCCTSGMTTGYFAEKMNQTAGLLDLDYTFAAVPYHSLYRTGGQYDAIFLAPQISYQLDTVRRALPHSLVNDIPSKMFAGYDVRQFLELIEKSLSEREENPARAAEVSPSPQSQEEIHHNILTIALVREGQNRFRFAVRLYGPQGVVLYNNDVIKHRLSMEDICDICDTAFIHNQDVHAVCIAMPGIITNGRVTLVSMGIEQMDVEGYLTQRYHRHFIVANDANCIALGYFSSQEQYHSMALLFQPVIGNVGGMGYIFRGQVIEGRNNVAGEIQYMPAADGRRAAQEWGTPEGARLLAGQILAAVISLNGPDLLLIASKLLSNIDKLREEIARYVPEDYLPEIRYIDTVREYMLLGAMITCVRSLKDL